MNDWADQREALLAAMQRIVAIGEDGSPYDDRDARIPTKFYAQQQVAYNALVACGQLPPEMPVLRPFQ